MKEQSSPGKFLFFAFLLFSYFFSSPFAFSQTRFLNVQVNFKVEEGNFDKSYLVLENVTTGEKQTLPGQSKYSLNLKTSSNYLLSFNKPGYITKKIEFNTSAPADRIEQGLYPVAMTVILIKQYDGVNIVVFNQPVAKYKYSKMTDDFDYDTDYTKQIQAALKDAEDELEQKKKEEKANAGVNAKAAEKIKADSIINSKAEAKAKLEEEQKQKAEAKAKQESEAKIKNDSIANAKKDLSAKTEEEKRQQAQAKMEEDERKKAAARLDAEEKGKAAKAQADEKSRKKALAKQDEEEKRKLSANAATGNNARKSPQAIEESEQKKKQNASAVLGADARQLEKSDDIPANVNVEEITEPNRTITKATVSKDNKQIIYLKITYKWGGVFYFENDRSISKDAFQLATRLK
jgi:hypothetical protein